MVGFLPEALNTPLFINEQMVKRIPISDDAYWKLLKLKAELKCETWTELVEKIYEIVIRYEKSE